MRSDVEVVLHFEGSLRWVNKSKHFIGRCSQVDKAKTSDRRRQALKAVCKLLFGASVLVRLSVHVIVRMLD